jgi:hypothetical protein
MVIKIELSSLYHKCGEIIKNLFVISCQDKLYRVLYYVFAPPSFFGGEKTETTEI